MIPSNQCIVNSDDRPSLIGTAYIVPNLCRVRSLCASFGLVLSRAEVYQWIGLFAAEQTAILLVEHNVRRLVKMSAFICVLSLGEITAQGGRARPSQ
jgi:branched-chain amino acid transport system ATP-binding protein